MAKAKKAKQTWTVRPFVVPEWQEDPLGTYKIQEVSDRLEQMEWDAFNLEPDEEVEKALAQVQEESDKVRKLIASAPKLLAALKGVIHHNSAVKPQYQLPASLIRQIEEAIPAGL